MKFLSPYSRPAIAVLLSLLCQFTSLSQSQVFIPVVVDDFNQATLDVSSAGDMALDNSGNPYIVYIDYNKKLSVRRYNGVRWEFVGPQYIDNASYAANYSIVIDANNTPYIAYISAALTIEVKKYDGSAWVNVGVTGFSCPNTPFAKLAFDNSGKLYCAYRDANDAVYVKLFNGTNWVAVGALNIISTSVDFTTSKGSSDLYVVYTDPNNGWKATVKKFDGTNWSAVGSAFGTASGHPKITTDNNGVPYVLHQSGGPYLELYKFNAGSWSVIGSLNALDNVGSAQVAFSPSNVPFVIYNNIVEGTIVKTFNGTAWLNYGSQLAGSTGNCRLTIDNIGNHYYLYMETSIYVQKRVGSTSTIIGHIGLRRQTRDMKGDNQGAPYIVHGDAVKKLNGTVWAAVGSTVYPNVANMEMASDTLNNILYCVFKDPVTSNLRVRWFDGSNWIDLGPVVSSVNTIDFNIAVAPSGELYVSYIEATTSKLTIRKFNGASWVDVSSSSWPQTIHHHDLGISAAGVPHVAAIDIPMGYMARVRQFNGTTWTDVGSPGFSAGVASFIRLAFDNNTPFVIYTDPAGVNNLKATVKKYNGASWQSVGVDKFSADSIDQPAVIIGSDGTPFACYIQSNKQNRITLMRFNGTAWVDVSGSGVSASRGYFPAMYTANNLVYISYSSGAITYPTFVKAYSLLLQILQQPLSKNIISGGMASFSVLAPNANSYQWQVNMGTGWIDVSNSGFYSNATTSELTVSSATTVLNGAQYRCVVANNSAVLISNSASLSVCTAVVPSVVITANPGTQVASGQNVVFSVVATNSGTSPVYQWRKNGVDIAGANNSTYSTNSLTTNDKISVHVKSNDLCSVPDTVTSIQLVMTVGVAQVAKAIEIVYMFPNPNDGNFTVAGYVDAETQADIEITNATGSIVSSRTEVIRKGNFSIYLKEQLPGGLYMLRVKFPSSTHAFKTLVD